MANQAAVRQAANVALGGSMTYKAPVADIPFTLDHIAGFSGHLTRPVCSAIWTRDRRSRARRGRAASPAEELAPLNRERRRAGRALERRRRHTAAGLDGGLPKFWRRRLERAAVPAEHGGQGLPIARRDGGQEMWNGANMAFGLNPLLTQAGVEALSK